MDIEETLHILHRYPNQSRVYVVSVPIKFLTQDIP